MMVGEEIKKNGIRGYPSAFILLEARPGFAFLDEVNGKVVLENKEPMYRGGHGYSPFLDEMGATMV